MDNYKKADRSHARVQAVLCDRTVMTDLSTDFSLPDYQPEIKRLLRVHATVSPPDKYVGAANAEFSGSVDYSILYAANDGGLYCATQAGEYQFSVPTEMGTDFDIGEGLVCDVETVSDMCTGRVAGPRKLSVKCRLRSHVRMLGTKILEESILGAKEDTVQRLRGSAECSKVFTGSGEALHLADEILCDTEGENLRVISATGEVYISEAVAGSGCVNCRGEVNMKLLLCHEGSGEAPMAQWRKIPFSQSVLTDGTEVNCECSAKGVCSDITVTVEDGRILCEVAVRIETKAIRNESVFYTRDAYSTEADGQTKYQTCHFPKLIKITEGNFSLNTMLPLEEAGIRSGQNVVDILLSPTLTELENENGKYILTGKCRCHAILAGEEDLGAQEFEIPLRYETQGSEEAVSTYEATVTPLSCRVRMDGERIGIDAELAVSLIAMGETKITYLSEAVFDQPLSHSGAFYTVCYPSTEDTLWSVAKRYHQSVATVSEANPLPPSTAADSHESLAGVSYLLV
ncbi:MAG: DUF3794 domain-containing protein [Clostridia bacterium]|nr:DUF3794 domain-containing protein [Clostridia bacterium]